MTLTLTLTTELETRLLRLPNYPVREELMPSQSPMTYRFGRVDKTQMRLLGQLSPARRLRTMLEARELAVGLIRGRLRRRYPNLPSREINLKLLEELARAQRVRPRP